MDTFHLILAWSGYAVAVVGALSAMGNGPKPVALQFWFGQTRRLTSEERLADEPPQLYEIAAGDRRDGRALSGRWLTFACSVVIALLSAILHRLVIT